MLQRTLAKSISVTGVGLHSGERVRLTLHPAAENSGILFRRTDLAGEQNQIIALSPYLINDTRLSSTVVTDQGVRVGTIEHIMSALAAYGIDNILIELNAPEIPIMDGSSLPFPCSTAASKPLPSILPGNPISTKLRVRVLSALCRKWN